MANDLIERYIYAVTKRLSPKVREDVSQELQGLVDDMLMERCAGAKPTEKDIRVVLTELGSPQELYAKYDEDANKCLIGQPYYSTYKLVLKLVLASVVFGLTVACGILQLIQPQPWLDAVGFWLDEVFDGLLSSFAVITVLFAFAARKGVQIGEPFNFDDLPPVPKKKQTIHWLEPMIGIAFSVVFLVLFLAVPQVFCFVFEGREYIPLFNLDIIHNNWLAVVLFGLCGIIRETVKLLEKRYNCKVLVVSVVTNVLSAVFAIWWLTTKNLINPDFGTKMAQLLQAEAVFVVDIFTNFQYFFLGVMLFALVLDTIDAAVKTLKK